MKKKTLALWILLGVLALALGGCSGWQHPDESQLPWARPAAWENSTPGMGI